MAGFDNILAPLDDVIKHLQVVQHSNTKRVFSCLNKAYGSGFNDLERQMSLELFTLTASLPMKETSIGNSQMVSKTPSYKPSKPANSWENFSYPRLARMMKDVDGYISDEYGPDTYSEDVVYL